MFDQVSVMLRFIYQPAKFHAELLVLVEVSKILRVHIVLED